MVHSLLCSHERTGMQLRCSAGERSTQAPDSRGHTMFLAQLRSGRPHRYGQSMAACLANRSIAGGSLEPCACRGNVLEPVRQACCLAMRPAALRIAPDTRKTTPAPRAQSTTAAIRKSDESCVRQVPQFHALRVRCIKNTPTGVCCQALRRSMT